MLSNTDQPKWVFAAQIGIGILAIILSILILINPIISIISLIVLVSVLLLVVGIEKVIAGIFVKNRARFSNLGLGILVIILAIVAMAFPVFVIILVAVALLFDGISRIVHGFSHKNQGKLDRAFTIGVGALEIALSIVILASPAFGFGFVASIIAIALFITGIQILVAGLTGRRISIPTSDDDNINSSNNNRQ